MKIKLEWTEEVPKVSGWYWAIEVLGDDYFIEVVQVVINSHESYALSTERTDRDVLELWDYWLGPLQSPKLPWE